MNKSRSKQYKQGDIYWYNFGEKEIEGKQMGTHPCIIVSNDLFNFHSPVVDILAISSKQKGSPVHVKIPSVDDHESFVYCEQWVTASKKELHNYIGRMDDVTLRKVIECLIFQITYRSRAGISIKEWGLADE